MSRAGWFRESYRHSLAARGVTTKRYMKTKDYIKGGRADGLPASLFPQDQIKKGIKVEMEHTTDKKIAREIAKDHLSEDPKYYDKLARMEASFEKPTPGRVYPVAPSEVKKVLSRMPEQNTKGLKGVEFVNPKGPQEDAWAQYARGKKKIKIFSQPVQEFNARGPQEVHNHIVTYVLPHEVGHHRALRGGKTDKSLEVAEARADANVIGMDPFDKDIHKIVAVRKGQQGSYSAVKGEVYDHNDDLAKFKAKYADRQVTSLEFRAQAKKALKIGVLGIDNGKFKPRELIVPSHKSEAESAKAVFLGVQLRKQNKSRLKSAKSVGERRGIESEIRLNDKFRGRLR